MDRRPRNRAVVNTPRPVALVLRVIDPMREADARRSAHRSDADRVLATCAMASTSPGLVADAHPPPHAASPTRDRLPTGHRPSQMPCTHSFRTNGGYTDTTPDRLSSRRKAA